MRRNEMPNILHNTPRWLRHPLYVVAFALTFCPWVLSASAQQAVTEQVDAKLTCGSHSANRQELKAFQVDLQFKVGGNLWIVDRTTSPQPGKENILGIMSRSGTMLFVGEGKGDDGSTWSYEFSGRKAPNGITILKGSQNSTVPKGTRSCSLTF
jgi:hypothetical protein